MRKTSAFGFWISAQSSAARLWFCAKRTKIWFEWKMVKLARSNFGGQLRTCDVTVYASHSCFTWLTRESRGNPVRKRQSSDQLLLSERNIGSGPGDRLSEDDTADTSDWQPVNLEFSLISWSRNMVLRWHIWRSNNCYHCKHTFSIRWCTVMMRLMRREFEAIIHLKGVEHDTWRDRPDLFTVNRCNYKNISVLCHWSLVENGSQMVKYLRSISRR